MNKIYTLTFAMIFGCLTAFAQNQTQTDSINQLNKQLQMTQDSLKKAQAQAQPPVSQGKKKDTRPLKQKIRFSLSTGFWINPNSVYFEVSPLITYYFPKTFSIGTGPTYVLNKNRQTNTSLNGWGGKIYGRADITRWLYGWTEYQGISNQTLNVESVYPYETSKSYEYVDSWFLSLGINIHLGRRSFCAQALYDVLYKESTSYMYSPWTYRVGFGF